MRVAMREIFSEPLSSQEWQRGKTRGGSMPQGLVTARGRVYETFADTGHRDVAATLFGSHAMRSAPNVMYVAPGGQVSGVLANARRLEDEMVPSVCQSPHPHLSSPLFCHQPSVLFALPLSPPSPHRSSPSPLAPRRTFS